MTRTHYDRQQIGTEIPRTGLRYNSDDNTYTEYTFTANAWACPVALCSRLTCERPLTADEIFDAMFS